MPLDGKISDYQTKPDVFSLEGLIAWLETQPGETAYDWGSRSDCMICRYISNAGLPVNVNGSVTERENYSKFATCVGGRTADIKVAMPEPWTYSAALTRARNLLAARGQE